MIYQRISKMLLLGLLVLPLASCSDDNSIVNNDKLNGDSQFGKANDVLTPQNGIQVVNLVQTKA